MNAFAIACWKPQLFHLQQALGCVASIRKSGYDEDVVVMTIDDAAVPKLKRACKEYDVIVKKCDPLVFYAHENWQRNRTMACLLDGNKLWYWTLTEYDSVIGIDCDCLLKKHFTGHWNRDEFITFSGGRTGPVCSAAMTVNPSMETFNEMRELIRTATFHPITGWNNWGPIKGIEGWDESHWRFQSADSLQGFTVYYFHCLKGIFRVNLHRFLGVIDHAGNQKRHGWYLRRLRELIGGRMTI